PRRGGGLHLLRHLVGRDLTAGEAGHEAAERLVRSAIIVLSGSLGRTRQSLGRVAPQPRQLERGPAQYVIGPHIEAPASCRRAVPTLTRLAVTKLACQLDREPHAGDVLSG